MIPPNLGLPWREGVGIVLLNNAGLVFVGERLDRTGVWQMPQGGMDEGEEAVGAALRELAEETGIRDVSVLRTTSRALTYDLPPELVSQTWNGRYRGQRQVWFAMRFEGTDDTIDIHGADDPEFRAWRWMHAGDIEAGIVAFKRDMYRDIFTAFADLLDKPGLSRMSVGRCLTHKAPTAPVEETADGPCDQ